MQYSKQIASNSALQKLFLSVQCTTCLKRDCHYGIRWGVRGRVSPHTKGMSLRSKLQDELENINFFFAVNCWTFHAKNNSKKIHATVKKFFINSKQEERVSK